MTQSGPPPPPVHTFMSGALPSMDYGSFSPMQNDFRDPFPVDARRSQQMDHDDLPQRMSSMDLGQDAYTAQKPLRKDSVTRQSIFRRSPSTSIPVCVDYELWRFRKMGDDWTDADKEIVVAPQKELAKKAKSGKSKSGKVLDQLQNMAQTRRGQINHLVDTKYRQTGFQWQPAYIEEVKAGTNEVSRKKDVKVFDVIIARASLNTSPRTSLARARPISISTRGGRALSRTKSTNRNSYGSEKGGSERVVLSKYEKDDLYEKKKDKDGDLGRRGRGKDKDVVDPDPFGNSKLFAPNGKPLDPDGGIPFDEVVLPPHIREDEPIGRRMSKRQSGSRGAKSAHGGDPNQIVEVLGDDEAFGEGGAVEILDSMNLDNILSKGKDKGRSKKGNRSRSRSRSRSKVIARERSRSKSRARDYDDHRRRGPDRVHRYMDERGSLSSTGSGESHFMVEDEDNTSFTSSSIHRDMEERGSLHRRGSSKYGYAPFREHYRGPQRERRGSQDYFGEQIIVSHREPRRLTIHPPRPKAITYGDSWDYPRSPSPRRPYGVPELLYPHELRGADERSEHYVDSYMRKDRLEDLRQRELAERERAVARRERAQRRISQGYGYVSDGRYR